MTDRVVDPLTGDEEISFDVSLRPGGLAEYVRIPFADTTAFKVPKDGLRDEQLLFISDAFPTGYMGADFCNIRPGDTVAVWGAGAVGLLAMKSAHLLGAACVIAIDRIPNRICYVCPRSIRIRICLG